MAKVFIGFSTVGKVRPPYQVNDIDLVKVDLMNHFYTRKGERVMLPEFGSIIHDYVMDPLDEYTVGIVVDDVKNVIGSDPRVQLNSDDDIKVIQLHNGIRIEVLLTFLPYQTPERLIAIFTQENSSNIDRL